MRNKLILAGLAALLAAGAALPVRADDVVLSFHRWAEDEKLVREPALNGLWDLNDSWVNLVFTFELHEDGEYLVEVREREKESGAAADTTDSENPVCPAPKPIIRLWGRLYEVRNRLFLELRPAHTSDELPLLVPARALLRARLEGNELTLSFASADWLQQVLDSGQGGLTTVETRDALLVTDDAQQLYDFLEFNSWDETAFSGDKATLQRRR